MTDNYAWLILSGISMLFGLQTIRVFFPGLMWSISRNPPLMLLLIIILAVFGLPIFVLFLLRNIELKKMFLWMVIGQATIRLLEQISQRAIIDFFITAIGIIIFVSVFLLIFLLAPNRSFVVGVGWLSGILLDTAIRGGLWTLDLSWQKGLWPIGLVLIFGLVQVISALNSQKTINDKEYIFQIKTESYNPLFAIIFSLFLFLHQHIFQDISQAILLLNWRFSSTLLYLAAGNCISLCLSLIFIRNRLTGKSWFFCITMFFGIVVLDYFSGKNLFLFEIFLGNCLVTNLFVLSPSFRMKPPGSYQKRFFVYWGLGTILYPLLIFLYYLTFTPLIFVIIVAVTFILLSWIGIRKNLEIDKDPDPRLRINLPFFGSLIILTFASPLLVILDESRDIIAPTPVPVSSSRDVRVMSINLHQGFDAMGNMAIYEQSQIIKVSDADIISMNEVNRGWLLDGSLDMYVWLSHELNMFSSYGPAMGHLSGNSVFSKFPLEDSMNSFFLNDPSRIPRAYLHTVVSLGDDKLNVVSTHLAWDDGGTVAREIEARQLTERFYQPKVLILGDMNSFPDSGVVRTFVDAGFVDAFAATGQQSFGYTWHSLEPVYRIDYVFGSVGIHFTDFAIIDTAVSDHLPLVVTISLSP